MLNKKKRKKNQNSKILQFFGIKSESRHYRLPRKHPVISNHSPTRQNTRSFAACPISKEIRVSNRAGGIGTTGDTAGALFRMFLDVDWRISVLRLDQFEVIILLDGTYVLNRSKSKFKKFRFSLFKSTFHRANKNITIRDEKISRNRRKIIDSKPKIWHRMKSSWQFSNFDLQLK